MSAQAHAVAQFSMTHFEEINAEFNVWSGSSECIRLETLLKSEKWRLCEFVTRRCGARRRQRRDLLRRAEAAARCVRRVFAGAPRRLSPAADPGTLCFDDFVWLFLAVQDRMLSSSVPYWFRVLDLDDDGCVCARGRD